jgi:hypothetical protein
LESRVGLRKHLPDAELNQHLRLDAEARGEDLQVGSEILEGAADAALLAEDVVDSVRNGRSPLILTERNEHLDRFAEGVCL